MAIFNKANLGKRTPKESLEARPLIMLVDDEPANLKVLFSIMEDEFDVLTACHGLEALALVRGLADPHRLRIVISDQRMPQMTGTELFEQLRLLVPKAVRIILTGYADLDAILDSINRAQIYRYFTKPFDRQDMLLTVRRAIEFLALQEAKQSAEEEAKRHLEQVNDVLRSTHRLKDLFLATVSHELRTPMHGVVGSLELLRTIDMSDEARAWLSDAVDSAQQMRCMLDEILGFIEIQTGTLKLKPKAFNLAAELGPLVDFATRACEQKGLQFHYTISAALPPRLISDAGLLIQILQHLLDNAIKFTDSGQITLQLDLADKSTDGTIKLRVRVTDTGPGISVAQQQTLFERFNQLDQSFNRRHSGLGLGLAICKKLAEMFKGTLLVESTVGHGSTFELLLPAQCDNAPSRATQDSAEGLVSAKTSKALVVDDNPVNRKVLQSMLMRLGHESLSAGNGLEALQLAEQHPFGIVFMDCQMPVMDGFEATQRLKNDARYLNTPVIAYTANASQNDWERAHQSGMCDLLKKPVTLAQLSECLSGWWQ